MTSIDIDFLFNGRIIPIQADDASTFQESCEKFLTKSLADPKTLTYLANGLNISNQECKIINLMNSENKKEKKLKILVNQFKEGESQEESSIIQSKGVICPKCFEPCRLEIKNYKIKLYDCVNKHVTENIKLKDYKNTQMVDRKKIICDNCNDQNLFDAYQKEFFKCLSCGQKLCPLCKSNHDKNHILVLYTQKNYICKKHNEYYIKYCKECRINICFLCEMNIKIMIMNIILI